MFTSFPEQAQCSFRPPTTYKNNFPPNIGIQGDGGLCIKMNMSNPPERRARMTTERICFIVSAVYIFENIVLVPLPICGHEDDLAGVLSPPDTLTAHHGLHEGVQATLGLVHVACQRLVQHLFLELLCCEFPQCCLMMVAEQLGRIGERFVCLSPDHHSHTKLPVRWAAITRIIRIAVERTYGGGEVWQVFVDK